MSLVSPEAPSEASRIPIIKLWNQLLVSLQGDVNDQQASRLREDILLAIQRSGAAGLVMDVSGLWLVDSHLCAVLAQVARSAKLMGTRTVLSGMSPDIAMTLQTMGVGLEGIETALGLEEALDSLGVRVLRKLDEHGQRENLDQLLDEVLEVAGSSAVSANGTPAGGTHAGKRQGGGTA